ncbi:head-to-tail connector protein [Rhodococcus phage Mbo2]|uniref:Head-to-tail connector protein n=1 Tax=Rhodococcus phage Mbo2 TaxID=2936911 RepID=A0A9E7IGU4_9CAUD|nr:head-to-tail connector protein [Rhodococcus phage Mbo2]
MATRTLESCYTTPAESLPWLGDLEIPRGQTMDEWVIKAADEMDGILGQTYRLPLDTNMDIPDHKADALLLKKINEFLAAGRLLLAAAGTGQDNSLNAYGSDLVNSAIKELARISSGRTVLESGELLDLEKPTVGVMGLNRDASSYVDQFYSAFGTAHQPVSFWERS